MPKASATLARDALPAPAGATAAAGGVAAGATASLSTSLEVSLALPFFLFPSPRGIFPACRTLLPPASRDGLCPRRRPSPVRPCRRQVRPGARGRPAPPRPLPGR
uniref:Uncharacterized protein n=1 Tax=Cairina moschata TaxID=8855 RepID=A0A8C3GQ82_CAIMO